MADQTQIAEDLHSFAQALVRKLKPRRHGWNRDGILPKSSNDHSVPRMTWWDRKGTTEWVAYRFPKPRAVSSAAVYWFDDAASRGGCRAPAEWKLLWRDGHEWKPVQLTDGTSYSTALNEMNKIRFGPIMARELKLEAKLKPGFSSGILEWRSTEAVSAP